ncbi:MAG: DUF2802 domain-containing protein [Deltaproteobacteria bacterium]|nr:DUF2802 domain-containing protein [Deltaproteobacteria bacterium]
MAAWWIVFLAFDMALMGGIIYILAFRKNGSVGVSAAAGKQNPAETGPAPSILMELKEELASVRKTAAFLEKKKAELEAFERSFNEKYATLDEMVKKAEESVKNIELTSQSRSSEDMYSKAMKMLRLGVPVEDVVKNLGILNGEVELISAINNYRQ